MRFALLLSVAAINLTVSAFAADDAVTTDAATKLDYPTTRKTDLAETQFGVKVADPYRWLEDDVRVNPEVADWVKSQNAVTDAYLETLPGKKILADSGLPIISANNMAEAAQRVVEAARGKH